MTCPLPPVDLAGLKDKCVLVTGGASGLGLETAQLFASHGAYVTIADVQPPLDDETLIKAGQHVQYVHCDVSDWDSQTAAFQKAISFSPAKALDVVTTFAAIDPLENLIDQVKSSISREEVTLETIERPVAPSLRCIDINLKGSYYSAALALHYFQLRPQHPPSSSAAAATTAKGTLIFISSLAGYLDDDHSIVYTTSKFGTRGLFRALRRRARDELGVRVNLVAPWAVKTPMTAPILKAMESMGIQDGKGITFAKKETCAQAVGRIALDETVHGRAYAIMPEGAFDIKDDIEGGYGGEELKVLMSWRKAAGDFLQG
ncbi:uncharacterized protein Z520_07838 [Fonsecaea multimorphosa CBS 102226]|uniref:Uncharacterized protein n=1 Tax=Fonsecaea multimorphosa CBS 102226 TaxID=1442371 RepID=A0A0D2JSX6_9EURO|nr:uncharacterized protein Z520_07838 [Fonsecaea multimorphosa CBS 102226]KIX96572.1 hypothetical protein Z520_07838 [Fonsecaea multimorphosa CBS 102226]OAL22084.1 hypothetical protein AYO22_07444 [Fonsecaea multimorphosa]